MLESIADFLTHTALREHVLWTLMNVNHQPGIIALVVGIFFLCVVTGAGLFNSRPGAYPDNAAFQIKLALIVLAGVNLLLFARFRAKTMHHCDDSARTACETGLGSGVARGNGKR